MTITGSDAIITTADLEVHRGSGELKPCPFCGHRWPLSYGSMTPNGKSIQWRVACGETSSLVPSCCASVWDTDPDAGIARSNAVAKWNRRPA